MSVQDEYGRHAYEGERDEDGNLRTDDPVGDRTDEEYRPEDPDGVVQGETLLPVEAEDEHREDGLGQPQDSGYLAEGDTVAEHSVTYDATTGEPVEERYDEATVVDGVSDDGVADDGVADGGVADDSVADSVEDDGVEDDGVEDEDESVDDVVAAEPVVAASVTGDVTDGSVADTTADDSTAADEPTWPELKGLFVDDPAAAVAGAASKVDAAIAALRDKGAQDSDTEHLRLAFRRYQDIYRSLTES
jgi:hypothetical protein